MLGHVNNTVFFRYCEQARIEWTYGLHEGGDAYAIDMATGRSVALPDRVTAPLRALVSAGGRAGHGG